MPTVKCRDCGRLAVRDRHKQGAIEASDLVRDEGWQIDSRGKQVIASTFCAARKRDLKATQSGLSAEVVAEINQEIECGGFRQWERGKSPEKHEEMTLLETLELRTLQWRSEDMSLQQQLRDDAERRNRDEKRRNSIQLLVQTLLTIVVTIATLIAAKLLPWFH